VGSTARPLFRDALERLARLASTEPEREHVTAPRCTRAVPPSLPHASVVRRREQFRLPVDRGTAPDDLSLIRRLYADLELSARLVPYREMLGYVRARPELSRINAHAGERSC
jgi:spore coat polysaccharide biosynthesis protein SpsF (cytidylyltransferase family)